MAAVWYYAKGDKQIGPISEDELRALATSGQLQPADMVWKQGMSGWAAASSQANLFLTTANTPPPLPTATSSGSPAIPTQKSSAASTNEQKALTHLSKAERLSDKGKFRPAIAEFTAAIRLNPLLWNAFLGRGEAYQLEDEHDRAIADFTEAIRLNPECADAYRERAYLHLIEDRLEQSIADVASVLRLKPNDAKSFYFRGEAKRRLRHYEEAIRDLSRSISLDPKDAGAFRGRGLAYWLMDDNEKAIADFSRSLTLDPETDFTAFCRGRAYFDAGRFREAIPDLERGLQDPDLVEDANDRLEKARRALPAQPSQSSYPGAYEPNPVVEAMTRRSSPSTSQATPPNTTAATQWWDCPWCGVTYKDDSYDPGETIVCNECNCQFQTRQAINLRSTKEREETKGLLGRLWSGSSIKKPRRQFLIETIRKYEAAIGLASLSNDVQQLQRAQLLQMKVAEMKQELRDHGG